MVPLAQAMRRLRHTTTRNRLYDTTNQRRRAVEPTSIWAVLRGLDRVALFVMRA